MRYFISELPTPILNTADFHDVFREELPFDELKLIRALEMIAFTETVFTVKQSLRKFILEVETEEYLSKTPLYIDSRFGKLQDEKPTNRPKVFPSAQEVLTHLKSRLGTPYIWGGNYAQGIRELLILYPPTKPLNQLEETSWTFRGLDCSGLLYEATHGATPRNTTDLLCFGHPVPIAHLTREEIQEVLRPLDLIVWRGHILIVDDQKSVIESHHAWGGVCQTNLKKRLELLRDVDLKNPTDDPQAALLDSNLFLVRRFIHF